MVAAVVDVLTRAGKRPAVVGDTPGMVVNRIQYAMLSEAFRVVEEGVASKEAIDTLIRNSLGFRLGLVGPFSIVDQAGVDIYASCYGILEEAFGERMAAPESLLAAVADGSHGTKAGRGLLGSYDEDALVSDPRVPGPRLRADGEPAGRAGDASRPLGHHHRLTPTPMRASPRICRILRMHDPDQWR